MWILIGPFSEKEADCGNIEHPRRESITRIITRLTTNVIDVEEAGLVGTEGAGGGMSLSQEVATSQEDVVQADEREEDCRLLRAIRSPRIVSREERERSALTHTIIQSTAPAVSARRQEARMINTNKRRRRGAKEVHRISMDFVHQTWWNTSVCGATEEEQPLSS